MVKRILYFQNELENKVNTHREIFKSRFFLFVLTTTENSQFWVLDEWTTTQRNGDSSDRARSQTSKCRRREMRSESETGY